MMSQPTPEPKYTFAVVSGEAHIADLLAEEGVIVEPAFACRFDGFVNDTFTEYRNPSIYRPPSVCQAQLESTLHWSLRWPGTFFLGFTLYDAAGAEETLAIWLGHRQLTTVRADWHDNRVHLYVITPEVTLKGGEQLRLVTAANRSAYRIENMVLLPRKPAPSQRMVEMQHLQADIRPTDDGHCQAVVTWITNLPAVGEVSTGGRKAQDSTPQTNHRLALTGLNRNRKYVCDVVSRVPGLAVARETLSLPTSPPTPQTQAQWEAVKVQIGPSVATSEAWPITTGLPFPPGALGDPARVRVLDPHGTEAPCQAEVTARWPDGGVKWLLLTFPAGLTANETVEYTVEYGSEVQPLSRPEGSEGAAGKAGLEVQETRTGVRIGTGPLQVEIDRDSGVLPGMVSLRSAETGTLDPVTTAGFPGLKLVDGRGTVYTGRIEAVEVEERGPERAVVRVELVHQEATGKKLFRSIARLHAYRGQTWLRMFHTCINDAADLFTKVRQLVLSTGLSDRAETAHFGEHAATELPPEGIRLFQRTEQEFSLTPTPGQKAEGRNLQSAICNVSVQVAPTPGPSPNPGGGETPIPPAVLPPSPRIGRGAGGEGRNGYSEGWVEVQTGKHTVLVGVRDFGQNYPKGLKVTPGHLEVELGPELGDADYHVGGLEEDRLFFYLLEGGYKIRRGMARTHELLYHFGPADLPPADVAQTVSLHGGEGSNLTVCPTFTREGRDPGRVVAALFQSPPPVRAPVDFYIASGVVGDLAPRDPERFGDYDRWVDEAGEKYEANTAARRAYGLLNYGDWHGERRYNWGNMEYDTPWGWLLEFLRGGAPACFDRGERAARHLTDVDTCHHDPDLHRLGGQYAHCMGHAGDYYPHGYREMATAGGGMSPSHTWVEGLFLYYALTGDRRIRECAEQTVRHLFATRLNNYDFTNCRDSGWLLIHAMAAYQATSEEVYRNAARVIVQRVLERQRPSGGWERLMVPGHCFCPPPRHYGNAGFMVGILLSGLKRYHQATGEEEVADAIVRGAEFLVRDQWVPEESCFHYTSCPHSVISPGLNIQVLEGLAYAQRLSGSATLREVVTQGVRRCFGPFGPHVQDEGVGKEISMNLRSAPFILYEVGRIDA